MIFLFAALLAGASRPAAAQLSPSPEWAVRALNQYRVFPNLTYLVANNYEAKLDIYKRRDVTGPHSAAVSPHPEVVDAAHTQCLTVDAHLDRTI